MALSFDELQFDNSFFRLGPEFYSRVLPDGLGDPYRICVSESTASLIGLSPDEFLREDVLQYFSGNAVYGKFEPLAMVYSGHQFGGYTPRLGDGRGLLLGEVDHAGFRWDLYLKGAGPTPYSRMGDGRAVLRSSIREFLCSEAMAGLGIPTTRGLCLIGSDDPVRRETYETAAMLVRVAPSHIRFGNFEYFFFNDKHESLKKLLDYTIKMHFPELLGDPKSYLLFFREVVSRTAKMIAAWQSVGFAHGVMNTDNMSILGETFDYGPFAFLDDYDPGFICNHSDYEGRYAFDKQSSIGLWNLARLGQALTPFISVDDLNQELDAYEKIYGDHFMNLMRAKLGLQKQREADVGLLDSLFELMKVASVDYTLMMRALVHFRETSSNVDCLRLLESRGGAFTEEWHAWMELYKHRLTFETRPEEARQEAMRRVNPKYILRTYLLQKAIEMAEKKDFSEVEKLLCIMSKPYDEQAEFEDYAAPPPDWGKCMTLTCSS